MPINKKHLFFREDARKILQTARKRRRAREAVSLDFSRVHFISRGFADELLNIVQELREKSVGVTFQNLHPAPHAMLRRVQQRKTEIQKAMRER